MGPLELLNTTEEQGKALFEGTGFPSRAKFESIALKEDELARSLREVSIRDPEYTSLQQVSAATIEMVQEALPDHTTLVECFVARDEVLVAGARSLMLSLSNIDDGCTAELMSRFYNAWRGGVSKSKALNIAMKAIREEYPNPFYWAPFLLVGKG